MILLQAQHVARHFGADVLFENINLDIQENSRIALVGKNGAGKSTLLKMIIGDMRSRNTSPAPMAGSWSASPTRITLVPGFKA